MKYSSIFIAFAVCSILAGCAARTPNSFNQTLAPGWASIEVRDDVDYDHAWDMVIGILVRDFDLAFVLKDSGYIATDWLYSWSGVYQSNYKVRIKVKFSDGRKKVEVKSEALVLAGDTWILGTDTRLVSTIKTDIMGTIGRTTR
ncbi:MAG: hypothetical protein AB1847_12855 [bacterium]